MPDSFVEHFKVNTMKLGVRCDVIDHEGQGHEFHAPRSPHGPLYASETLVAANRFLASLPGITAARQGVHRRTPSGFRPVFSWSDHDDPCSVDSGSRVKGAGLKELAVLEQLRDFAISGVDLTDEGVAAISAWRSLESLVVRSPRLTNKAMKDVARLTNLTHLTLRNSHGIGTKRSDAGVKELAALTKLVHLDLSGSQVTLVGLEELVSLDDLRSLHLADTPKIRNGQVDTLRAWFPNTTVYR